jgi:hypothetical protein
MKSWDKEEEKNFMKYLSEGMSINQIAGALDRSSNALKLRLRKIIYESITNKGIKPEEITKNLRLDTTKVMAYYNDYKNYLKKRDILQEGGNNILQNNIINNKVDIKVNNKVDKLKQQNEMLREIIDNITLKKKLKHIYKK